MQDVEILELTWQLRLEMCGDVIVHDNDQAPSTLRKIVSIIKSMAKCELGIDCSGWDLVNKYVANNHKGYTPETAGVIEFWKLAKFAKSRDPRFILHRAYLAFACQGRSRTIGFREISCAPQIEGYVAKYKGPDRRYIKRFYDSMYRTFTCNFK